MMSTKKTQTQTTQTTQTTTAGPGHSWTTVKYAESDGKATYRGGLDRFGLRSGEGTFRFPTLIYGINERTPTVISWLEYRGEWRNDMANGYGYATRFCCDGYSIASVERGIWVNGRIGGT